MQQNNPTERNVIEIDIVRIAKACRQKIWLILLVAAVMACFTFVNKKQTYVPTYKATATMYSRYADQDGASSANTDKLTGTCIAVLKTRKTLKEVIKSSGVDISTGKLSSMLTTSIVNNSHVYKISVTATDPEEAKTLANHTAKVLPKVVSSYYPEYETGIIDTAVTPSTPTNKDEAVKGALSSAVLGIALTCGVIAAKVFFTDPTKEKKARK